MTLWPQIVGLLLMAGAVWSVTQGGWRFEVLGLLLWVVGFSLIGVFL